MVDSKHAEIISQLKKLVDEGNSAAKKTIKEIKDMELRNCAVFYIYEFLYWDILPNFSAREGNQVVSVVIKLKSGDVS